MSLKRRQPAGVAHGNGGNCIDRSQQHIDRRRAQRQLVAQGRDKNVLYGMGQFHQRVEAQNPRPAFQGMRGPHEFVQHRLFIGRGLQRHEALRQHRNLPFRFLAEDFEHGQIAKVVVTAHRQTSVMASNSRSSSSKPTSCLTLCTLIAPRDSLTSERTASSCTPRPETR